MGQALSLWYGAKGSSLPLESGSGRQQRWLGLVNTVHWGHDLANDANRQFVAGFEKEYGRLPTVYASQGYDTARLIDAAVRDVNGKVEDKEAVIQALRAKRFQSVRGDFKWDNNNHPIQDLVRAHHRPRCGRPHHQQGRGHRAEDLGDPHAGKCPLKW